MTEIKAQNAPDIGVAPDIDSSTDEYALRFSGKAGEWLLSIQSSFTKQHLQQVGATDVCDVGGGHAQNVKLIESMGISLTVVGSNSGCSTRVTQFSNSESTQFVVSALNKLEFESQSQSHIVSYRIVSHMDDWQAYIQELCRVSADAVTIDFATRRSVNYFSELAYKLKRGQEGDTRRYNVVSESVVDQIFRAAAFQKDIRSAQFFFPMAIHRKLNSPSVSMVIEKVAGLFGLRALFGSPVIATYRREAG